MSSSLDLLNPKPWASRKRPWASETSKHLESLSHQLISVASSRNWSHPLFTTHISPNYKAEFDHSEGALLTTWKAYVEWQTKVGEANPDYKFEVLDSCGDIYEKTGMGSVYMLLRVCGHPRNVVRESIIVMFWRKEEDGEEGRWVCEGQKVIRGMVWNA